MEERTQDAFWLVWCPTGESPRRRHPTKRSAENEAERLARLNPGREFIVLEPVSGRIVSDMSGIRFEHPI